MIIHMKVKKEKLILEENRGAVSHRDKRSQPRLRRCPSGTVTTRLSGGFLYMWISGEMKVFLQGFRFSSTSFLPLKHMH